MKKRALILIVREFDKFSSMLVENGFETINLPAIKTVPIENLSELEERIGNLKIYDGLFFTSPQATKIFLKTFENKSFEFRGKVYCLGNRTKELFDDTNFEVAFRPAANTAEEFIKSFENEEFVGKRFLFLRGDKSLQTVPELLKNYAIVDEIIVYRTIENTIDESLENEISERLVKNEVEWICFFSPSGVESFVRKFGKASLNKVKIASIGATTAKNIAENDLNIKFISSKANSSAFAFELIEHIKHFE